MKFRNLLVATLAMMFVFSTLMVASMVASAQALPQNGVLVGGIAQNQTPTPTLSPTLPPIPPDGFLPEDLPANTIIFVSGVSVTYPEIWMFAEEDTPIENSVAMTRGKEELSLLTLAVDAVEADEFARIQRNIIAVIAALGSAPDFDPEKPLEYEPKLKPIKTAEGYSAEVYEAPGSIAIFVTLPSGKYFTVFGFGFETGGFIEGEASVETVKAEILAIAESVKEATEQGKTN